MSIIYALNGISYLAISLLSFFIYVKFARKEETKKAGDVIGAGGILYLLMAFLNFFWFFRWIVPNDKDFLLLNTTTTVFVSVLVTYTIYRLTYSKNVIYILLLYITTLFAVTYSKAAFLIATIAISHLLLALVFLDLAFVTRGHLRKAGDIGLFYIGASILASAMHFLGDSHKAFWFVPNIILGFVLIHIFESVRNAKTHEKKHHSKKNRFEHAKTLARFLVFVIALSAFVLVSTVSIHELGHAFVAQYYGCSQFKAVIYDIVSPHTELICDSVYYNNLVLTLAGMAATLACGLIFLLTGISFTKGVSYMIFGFGLMFSYGDLKELGFSSNLLAPLVMLSLVIIGLSIVKVSLYYLRQQEIFQ